MYVSGLIGYTASALPIYVSGRPGIVLGVMKNNHYRVRLTDGPLPFTVVVGSQLALRRGNDEPDTISNFRLDGGRAWYT